MYAFLPLQAILILVAGKESELRM